MWHKALVSFLIIIGAAVLAFADTGEEVIVSATSMYNSDESCIDVVDNHKLIIEKSEQYLAEIVKMSDDQLRSYDIMILQKVLKSRYDHLMKLMAKFHSPTDCNLPALGKVMAVYDFNLLAQNTMIDKETRRMIHSFTKAKAYGMKDFKKDYYYFTDIRNIEKIRNKLAESENGLVDFFGLKIDYQNSGIPLSTLGDKAKRIWSWMVGKGLINSWGKLSDFIKFRHGHLHDNLEVRDLVLKKLKPLDLLFEKRKFVLSNLTIPGYWGHVAIWLGTKEELIKLGVWDQEFFTPFRDQVERGRNIVQMRKEGVVFNSLEEFMNLDEIAINRVSAVQDNVTSVYKLIVENLNKKYDFSFDAKSLGKITCTELVTFSYGNIAWPTHFSMGRLVIRPDDVAALSLSPTSSDFITYIVGYPDGAQVKSETDWLSLFSINE